MKNGKGEAKFSLYLKNQKIILKVKYSAYSMTAQSSRKTSDVNKANSGFKNRAEF